MVRRVTAIVKSSKILRKLLKSVESIARDLKTLIDEGGVGDETQSEDEGEAFVSPPPRARVSKPLVKAGRVPVPPRPPKTAVARVAPTKSPSIKYVSAQERQEFKDEYIKKGGKMGRGRPPAWWASSEEKADADRQLQG
jgi:hypothetical protein